MDTAIIQGSARGLMAEAREATGIGIDDATIEEALERLLHALNSEAELHERGARAMRERLLRLLCNRLRFLRDLAAHPEITAQTVNSPVILTGGPRTGSTRLHKLLAASGDFRILPFWRGYSMALRTGDRDEDAAPRIAEADDYVCWIAKHAPDAQRNHAYGTFEPEEEVLLLEHFICSTFPSVNAYVPSFMAWWAKQDFTDSMWFLRSCLQYLQWQFDAEDTRRWVLKCPIYPGREDLLAEIFPGAVFVTTNRHPANTVVSSAALVAGYHRASSDVDRRILLGRAFLDGLAAGARAHMVLRDKRPELAFLDVGFAALAATPINVVEAVYRHAGMTLSDKARKAILAWEAGRGRFASGSPLALADFGLTPEMVEAKFDDYIARFNPLF